MNLRILVTALILPLCTVGCGNFTLFPGVHRIEIQQGNIIDQDMVDQLKPGMTKAQVRFVLGTPLIADTFDQERWDYYYSTAIGAYDRNKVTERFSVFFKDDALHSFEGNIAPSNSND